MQLSDHFYVWINGKASVLASLNLLIQPCIFAAENLDLVDKSKLWRIVLGSSLAT